MPPIAPLERLGPVGADVGALAVGYAMVRLHFRRNLHLTV